MDLILLLALLGGVIGWLGVLFLEARARYHNAQARQILILREQRRQRWIKATERDLDAYYDPRINAFRTKDHRIILAEDV